MKKYAFFTFLLFFVSINAFANQFIAVPKNLNTQMTRDWLLVTPTEMVTVTNPDPLVNIEVIIFALMRGDTGAPYNGVNVVCNGSSHHVNAGSFYTCLTSADVSWTNDDVMSGVWAQGFVTVGFKK